MSLGWMHPIMLTPTYSIIYYGNILFYLCALFQEQNYGVKQGCGVMSKNLKQV
jgi:hypothetical protein